LPANPKAKDYTEKFDGDRRFFDLKVAFTTRPIGSKAKSTTSPTM